ncbi:MAG: MBL fold metallo-hydrolase [Phycisphaera sp.]|nr:MBL fold metallo-hydrolase [Phycisphaera sp.]
MQTRHGRSLAMWCCACAMWAAAVAGCATTTNRDATSATLHRPAARVLPDLFMWRDTCNVYVLRDGDAALLINVGAGEVVDHLADLGVKRVEWVLMTDHHREQCQGVDRLDRGVTKIAAPAGERDLFEKPTDFRRWFPKLGDRYTVHGASYVRPPARAIAIDRALKPGEVFTWRGYAIQCVDTPGHAPGGMSYVIRRGPTAIAFTGGVMRDGARMTNWYDTEWDYGFAKGLDTLIKSVDTLIAWKPEVALPSQGPVIHDATAQLTGYHDKLTAFRADYVRGYPVFNGTDADSDAVSTPTEVPLINQVTPHLYKLSHKTKGKNFAIIIADDGHALVLDCGLFPEKMLDEILDGLREHMGLKQIDAMWISHMHGDHFLLGPVMREKHGAQMWTLDTIVDKCEHPRRYDYCALVSSYGDGFDGMPIDKGFRSGESVMWEGYRVQVDWMPGQTEFGCSLWLDIDGKRIVFTGDNLFGNPSDPKQNGHECVVARNSSIIEEGYLVGSRYLLDLKPDIVMGSHSYVMGDPMPFLRRYHAWSKRIINLYQGLMPDRDYEYGYDPYWVSAYPYRVDLTTSDEQQVTITVRNFRDAPQRHHVVLDLPDGVTADPPVLDGVVDAKSRASYPVTLHVDRAKVAQGLQIVPFDITLDGRHYGELFDFVMQARE